MVVTWTTYNKTNSVVEYGIDSFSLTAKGSASTFFDKNDTNRVWFIHHVVLDDLKPGVRYSE